MAEVTIYNPEPLGAPLGQYSHIARVKNVSETIYIAGMLSAERDGTSIGIGDISAQITQVFANLKKALDAEQLRWGNVAQFTTYLTDAKYIEDFMTWRKANFPKMFTNGKYPPNTLLIVKRLVREEFLVEVQTIAVK